MIAKSTFIKEGKLSLLQETNQFIDIFPSEWSDNVSSRALRNLHDKHLDKEIILPLTNDLMKLFKNLDKDIKELTNLIKNSSNIISKQWKTLASTTLCKLIVFNKRRGGEVGRMFMDSYLNRTK